MDTTYWSRGLARPGNVPAHADPAAAVPRQHVVGCYGLLCKRPRRNATPRRSASTPLSSCWCCLCVSLAADHSLCLGALAYVVAALEVRLGDEWDFDWTIHSDWEEEWWFREKRNDLWRNTTAPHLGHALLVRHMVARERLAPDTWRIQALQANAAAAPTQQLSYFRARHL